MRSDVHIIKKKKKNCSAFGCKPERKNKNYHHAPISFPFLSFTLMNSTFIHDKETCDFL